MVVRTDTAATLSRQYRVYVGAMPAENPKSEILRTMPLHAITEVYGEPGLRQRFLDEIARFPGAHRDALTDALTLAARLHRESRL